MMRVRSELTCASAASACTRVSLSGLRVCCRAYTSDAVSAAMLPRRCCRRLPPPPPAAAAACRRRRTTGLAQSAVGCGPRDPSGLALERSQTQRGVGKVNPRGRPPVARACRESASKTVAHKTSGATPPRRHRRRRTQFASTPAAPAPETACCPLLLQFGTDCPRLVVTLREVLR